MKNYDKEIEKEKLACEEKIANLEKEKILYAQLPDSIKSLEIFFHFYKLFGRELAISIKEEEYSYKPEKPKIAFTHILDMADKYPENPMYSAEHFGAKTFVTKQFKEEKENDNNWGKFQEVAPFTVKIGLFQSQTATIEWFSNNIEINMKMPLYGLGKNFGDANIKYSEYLGGTRVSQCEFNASNRIKVLHRDNNVVANLEPRIKWGRGSDNVPNDFTLFWTNNTERGEGAKIRDLVAALMD